MQATRRLLQHRQPMIRFLGKRFVPKSSYCEDFPRVPGPTDVAPDIDHSPHVHPAAPDDTLPRSFKEYRNRAVQHGPLNGQQQSQRPPKVPEVQTTQQPYGSIGGRSAQQLGSVEPRDGEFWDRNDLPARFRRGTWTLTEMEAVESGGASLFA